jgi:hypothetical protein
LRKDDLQFLFQGLDREAKRGTAEIQTASGDPVPYRNSGVYRHLGLEAADKIWGWALRLWGTVQCSHDQVSSVRWGTSCRKEGCQAKTWNPGSAAVFIKLLYKMRTGAGTVEKLRVPINTPSVSH